MPHPDDLQALKDELAALRQQQEAQSSNTEQRLERLERRVEVLFCALYDKQGLTAEQRPVAAKINTQTSTQAMGTANQTATPSPTASSAAIRATKATPGKKAKQPNPMLLKLQQVLVAAAGVVIGPVASLWEQGQRFFAHYRARGQGPVFLLTLAGIIAMTLGFGYLLQYSFSHWLSEMGKTLAGFTAANAILALGLWIRKRKPQMVEFGAGLMGLGLILNYLCAYFAGPYYGLVTEVASYLILLLITVAGYALAIRLETRVISVIALIGGSLAPLILLPTSQAPQAFFPYLLLIGSCSFLLCFKTRWATLLELTALVHMAAIEWASQYLLLPLPPSAASTLTLVSLHGLFYLYGLGSLWLFGKAQVSHRMLAMPAILLAFLIYSLSSFSAHGSWLLLGNGLALFALGQYLKTQTLKHWLWLGAGALGGFAAITAFDGELLGLVLLLEAVLMLHLGIREKAVSLRLEGLVLLAMAMVLSITGLAELEPPGSALLSVAMASLLAVTATLWWCSHQMASLAEASALSKTEAWLPRPLQELANLWLVISALVAGFLISARYFPAIVPALSALLLWLSSRKQLRFSELLAWLLLLLPLGQVLLGMLDSGSPSFSDQPLYARIARVELFLCLALGWYGYRRLYPRGRLNKFAWQCRLLAMMLLPLLWLPKLALRAPEWLAIGLWASALLSTLISRWLHHRWLRLESRLLLYAAFALTASGCLMQQWQGLAALAIGSLLLALVLLRMPRVGRLWRRELLTAWQLAPFYGVLVVAVLGHLLEMQLLAPITLSAAAVTVYLFALLRGRVSAPLRAHYYLAYVLFLLSISSPWVAAFMLAMDHGAEPLLVDGLRALTQTINLILLAQLMSQRARAMRLAHKAMPMNVLTILWHSLLFLLYLPLAYLLPEGVNATLSTVLMVIHGSCLMFISLKPGKQQCLHLAGVLFAVTCAKLLLVDLAEAALVQKILVFMLVGAILLAVAYFYQQARNRLVDQRTSEGEA